MIDRVEPAVRRRAVAAAQGAEPLPGPHVTDLGLVDGTTGQLVPSMLL